MLANELELTLLLLNKDKLLLDIVAADWLLEKVIMLELDDSLLATDELIPTAEVLLARLLELTLATLLKGVEESPLDTRLLRLAAVEESVVLPPPPPPQADIPTLSKAIHSKDGKRNG